MPILIVEDDRLLADAVAETLRPLTEVIALAHTGAQALDSVQQQRFNLLVLDIGLPGLSGFDVLRRIRARDAQLPVLILTARDAVEDRVRGLGLGADDYLVKPFDSRELDARARALLRRARHPTQYSFNQGALSLDTAAQRAFLHGEALELSAREWQLLRIFAERAGRILDKDSLIDALCGMDEAITPNAIEVYVSRLRAKLSPAGLHLRTVRGLGYLLEKADGS